MKMKKKQVDSRLAGLKVEDLLNEELRREMGLEADPFTGRLKLRQNLSMITDWEDIMHSVYEIPIELEGYTKKVSELKSLNEMVDILSSQDFDQVKRSESRKKQLKQFVRTMHMYYNLVFTRGKERIGFGALIYFPSLRKDNPERSSGIVLIERKIIRNGKTDTRFERAKFDDFLIEVRPYIEILGDLYRKSRRP